MSIWTSIKAAFSPAKVIDASVRFLEGYGSHGSKPRPFRQDVAARHFQHWAYAAAMKNAHAVAGVPLRLYVRKRSGQKLFSTRPVSRATQRYLAGECTWKPSPSAMSKAIAYGMDVEEVVEPHPVLEVLGSGNDWANGHEMAVLRTIDKQLTGNAYLHPIIDARMGVPSELWRLPPQWVQIIPDKQQFVKGYLYGRSPETWKEFAVDEVIHFKLPNPNDLHYGMGWVEAAWTALALHQSKREMDVAKFDNMARPDWLLIVKGGSNRESLDRFENKVNEKLRGTDKAGKFLTISGDVATQALNLPVEEVGTATRVIEEIAAVSGVPVAMLLSNDPNRANSVAARLGWYRDTIRPYCIEDEQQLNAKWVPLFEGSEDYFLSYDLVSFEDEEAQAKRLTGYVAGGILTPNEARAEIGYLPTDDGDDLVPPAGAGQARITGDLEPRQNDERQN